jgi:hypothetical protein
LVDGKKVIGTGTDRVPELLHIFRPLHEPGKP